MFVCLFVLTAEGGRLGYTNPAFGVSLTEEEFREIQRISQLPLGDSAEVGVATVISA